MMSEQDNLDIGRIVSLIMENPQIIEQISALTKQMPKSDETEDENPKNVEKEGYVGEEIEQTVATNLPTYPTPQNKNNRAQLLCALKPYVSKDRAKAIDSMISIADILDMMKGR